MESSEIGKEYTIRGKLKDTGYLKQGRIFCKDCARERCLVDDLCDDCTIKRYGTLCPWVKGDEYD